MAANTKLAETKTQWTLSNPSLSITIDKSNGTIVNLVDAVDGFDACHPHKGSPDAAQRAWGLQPDATMIGGLRIADELTGETFCDLATPSAVTVVEAGAGPDGSQQVVLDKLFDGAQFTVRVTYRLEAECLFWLAEVTKNEGADRSVRIVFIVPQPSHRLWGPMHDPFIDLQPEQPVMIRHGLAHGRAVASQRRAVPVPLLSFVRKSRCMALALPVEVPNVLVRFMNNADEKHLNVRNSLTYAQDQREYFKVSHELLGLRDSAGARAGVLISAHDGQWRPALAWYARRYAKYFQPDPKILEHDGVYHGGRPFPGDEAAVREQMKGRRERGVRWAELHAHFPHYGLYVNPTEPWTGEHSDVETTYDLVRRTIALYQEQGIKVHIYYNIIDGKCSYVEKEFPESIVVNEAGEQVPAFRECWLMNADPAIPFGRHCLEQFDKLMETYPKTDAIFFDVYGRHYNLDFGHDDGITMVHNKPAYCLKFAFQRIMDQIEPKLRAMGKQFSANKPEGIEMMAGIDMIMADEGHDPYRLEAFSYYGLFKPIMVLDGRMWSDPEPTLKTCLRLGMMYNDYAERHRREGVKLSDEHAERNRRVRDAYTPLLWELIAKRWVLEPNALELPEGVRGNIFEAPDGRLIVTMVSELRRMFENGGFMADLPVVVRVPDAKKISRATVRSVDYDGTDEAALARDGEAVTVTVPRHRTASIVILER